MYPGSHGAELRLIVGELLITDISIGSGVLNKRMNGSGFVNKI